MTRTRFSFDVEFNVKSRAQSPKHEHGTQYCNIPDFTCMQGLVILHELVSNIWPERINLTDAQRHIICPVKE